MFIFIINETGISKAIENLTTYQYIRKHNNVVHEEFFLFLSTHEALAFYFADMLDLPHDKSH